jgi:hypothetical protein
MTSLRHLLLRDGMFAVLETRGLVDPAAASIRLAAAHMDQAMMRMLTRRHPNTTRPDSEIPVE